MDKTGQYLPIVGVGASAGGLEAYRKFLEGLPDDPGAAFVLIQHLDPNHESLMVDLLARHTAMRVVQAKDDMVLERNTVYAIPPGKFIGLTGRGLSLRDPVRDKGVRLSIDHFFRSLAETHGERSIGIVLSGTGADGTLGIREIKAAGGMVMVQQSEDAEYDGMPRSAIATGVVDFVETARDLGPRLVEFLRHPYLGSKDAETGLAQAAPDGLNEILTLLRQHTDFDFRCYKKGMIERRIHRRMGLRQIKSVDDYVRLVRDAPDEVHQLSRDLLIGVTRFFRETAAWNSLAENVLDPLILGAAKGATLRAWVPGCASGEEAYTLAMLMFERIDRLNRNVGVQIFATDLNARAIETARAGLYPVAVAGDIPAKILDRYFIQEGDALRANKRLRETVVFATQNVISDPPFSKLDLITCRNLMIYLEADVQARLIDMFHFALSENGHLFLGSSENAERPGRLFTSVDKANRIFRRSPVTSTPSRRFPALPAQTGPARVRAGAPSPSVGDLARRHLLDRFAPASVVVDRHFDILYQHGPLRSYLEFPEGEPSRRLPHTAIGGLRSRLRAVLNSVAGGRQSAEAVARDVVRGDGTVAVRIRAESLAEIEPEGGILVTFEDIEEQPAPGRDGTAASGIGAGEGSKDHDRIAELEYDLKSTREDLQSTIEEMETANEELKASNEELQSTNEELETSREELQSLNEELSTVNSQLEDKVAEVEATNNDLRNLLASTDIAVIFLDTDLVIRRFTPAMKDIMRVIDTDVGRPVEDIAMRAMDDNLIEDARQCLDRLVVSEAEIQTGDDRHLIRKIRPYRTFDNKIEGVVITYTNVTRLQHAVAATRRRELQQAAVADLGREALAGTPLDRIFEQAVEELARRLGVRFTKVLQLDPDGRHLLLRTGVGWKDGLVGTARVHTGIESQAGFTLSRAAPVVVESFETEKRFNAPSLLLDHDIVCGASVIIGPVEAPWGVLGVHETEAGKVEFTIDDVNFVQAVANTLWLAISGEQSRREIQRERGQLRGITDGLPILLAIVDREQRYEFVNAAYEAHGRSQAEIEGMTVSELLPAQAYETVAPRLAAAFDGEAQTFEIEFDMPGRTGLSTRHITYVPRRDPQSGAVTGLFCASVDVSEEKELQRSLVERTLQYRALGESIPYGVWITDADGSIDYVSQSFLDMVGMTLEEVQARGWTEALAPHTAAAAEQAWQTCRASGDAWEQEHEFNTVDGDTRHVLTLGRPVRDDTGKITSWVGLNLDITNRKDEENRLVIVSAELDHRVKNILAIVATLAKMTGRSVKTVGEYSSALEMRIQALASAHRVLAGSGWRGMGMASLLELEIAPYRASERANIQIDGKDLLLQPSFAQLMSLGFHELATNAAKYGGLSDAGGSLKVRWTLDDALVLDWIEATPSETHPPERQGFGSTLLKRVLSGVVGVTVTMDFKPEGLHFKLVAEDPYEAVLLRGKR